MKKNILTTALFLLLALTVKAQSYLGYLTDNYSGINSVISNPANIADSRFKTDINLAGASALFGNDLISFSAKELFSEGIDVDNPSRRSPEKENNAFANGDILGPSFMFNINDKSSVALFTRGRALGSVTDVNGEFLVSTAEDFENDDYFVDEGTFNASVNGFTEIGATYAREIYNESEHYVKGGLSLKYLRGAGNVYASGRDLTVDYDLDGTSPTDGSITSTGEVTYGNSNPDDVDDFNIDATGFGVDLGFVYEWRPEYSQYNAAADKDKNKYKVKVGLSVTDLGTVTYKDADQRLYDVNKTVSESDFDEQDDEQDVLENLYTRIDQSGSLKALLPGAVHLNADYHYKDNWYLNLNTDISLMGKNKENASRMANLVTLTPRYESKWFSFYTPLSYMQHSGFQAGLGLRAGPLYLGSGSIISVLASDNSKAFDAYAGLKVPIYHGTPKDKDNDGVVDKLDECPTVRGPKENGGCPWKDTDGDTVLDKDDACPEVAGAVANKGCEWEDTDGDTVLDKDDKCPKEAGAVSNGGCPAKDTDGDTVIDKDDKCPTVAGDVANNGCPKVEVVQEVDSDGDTVVDSLDRCPNVRGTVANNGCPAVSQLVVNELNYYAKTILFNSGKSTIKTQSYKALTDIVNILNKYPEARFSIGGHTDSVGSDALNEKLSDRRANAVMSYLVNNGVNSSSLSAIGYGELYPVDTNDTAAGRKNNRRVEISLIN